MALPGKIKRTIARSALATALLLSHYSKMFVRSKFYKYYRERRDYLFLRFYGVETQLGYVTLNGFPIIRRFGRSRIILGRDVTLVSRSEDNIAGINHPVILATLTDDAVLRIDEGCGLSGVSLCAAAGISIGKRCLFGANAAVYDTDFHPTNPLSRRYQSSILDAPCSPICIGDDVWIGANSMLLKGSCIGDAGVVGACSVVIGVFLPRALIAGNPARLVRYLD